MASQIKLNSKMEKIFQNAMGGSYKEQKRAAKDFAIYLECSTYDSLTMQVVEKAVDSKSWHFLLQLFISGVMAVDKKVVDCLMAMSNGDTFHHFIHKMFNFIIREGFHDLELAVDLLVCILSSRSVCVNIKKRCFRELMQETDNRATHQKAFHDLGIKDHAYILLSGDTLPRVPSEQLDELMEVLQADKDSVCQKYALALAARLGKWELAWDLQEQGTSCDGLDTDDELFKAALSAKAFRSAGSMLQNCLRNLTPPKDMYRDAVLDMMHCTHKECGSDKQTLSQFIEECKNNHLFMAGAYVAVWAGDLKEARKLALREFDKTGDMEAFFTVLLDRDHYCLVMEMLNQLPGPHAGRHFQAVVSNVLRRAADRCFSPGPNFMVEKLLNMCSDTTVLVADVLFYILEHCETALFCTFLAKDCVDLSQACVWYSHMGPVFNTIVTYLSQYSSQSQGRQPASSRKAAHAYDIMLRKCIEAGLSTHSAQTTDGYWDPFRVAKSMSPLETAVRSRNFELTQMLYRTGATCNAQVYRLTQDVKLRVTLESKQQTDLLDYLDTAASNPRSLQELCVLTVSHHIGCRGDRKHRALNLGLPLHMVHKVLFYDVLFP